VTTNKKRGFLRVIGYIAFFMAAFVISLVITFPYNRLTGYVEQQARNAMGVEVSIEKLRPTITGGVRLDGVTLGPSLKARPGGGAPGGPFVHLDRAVIGVSWLGLLLGSVDVSFDCDLADGQAEGSYEQNDEHTAMNVSFQGLQAKQVPILQEKVGLPVQGTIVGHFDFDIPAGDVESSEGEFELGLQGVVIGDGKARLSLSSLMGYGRGGSKSSDDGTLIQPIEIGPVALESKLVKGVADIPRVDAVSEHAELSFEGRIKLAEPLAQSRVDTYLTVKLTKAYAEQDEQTSTLIGLADTIGSRAKRADGSFGFRMSGSFGAGISFRASKSFSLPGKRGGARAVDGRRPSKRRRPPRGNRGGPANSEINNARPIARPPSPSIRPRPTPSPGANPTESIRRHPSGMPHITPGATPSPPSPNYPPTETPTSPDYPQPTEDMEYPPPEPQEQYQEEQQQEQQQEQQYENEEEPAAEDSVE